MGENSPGGASAPVRQVSKGAPLTAPAFSLCFEKQKPRRFGEPGAAVGPARGCRVSQKQPHVSMRGLSLPRTLTVFLVSDHLAEKPDLDGAADLCGRASCVS